MSTIPTGDLRIQSTKPLISPAILMHDFPASAQEAELVTQTRQEIADILSGKDDRLLVVVGPCSIHDTAAALEYANFIQEMRQQYRDTLLIVMRVYFEKPRTTVGWKGLINDPHLNNSFDINEGLRRARGLLKTLAAQGIPAGTEFLDAISPQYIADLVVWGAIGARTTESQVHRELASGLSMPVGFKNGTGGSRQIAIDAIGASSRPHHFLSVTKQGVSAIVETTGNEHCHIILRGGAGATNYSAADVQSTQEQLKKAGVSEMVMVDCSHANSLKNHKNQKTVAQDLATQISAGNKNLFAVMIESNLVEGNQKLTEDLDALTYGQSVTDACVHLEETVEILSVLSDSVQKRRSA